MSRDCTVTDFKHTWIWSAGFVVFFHSIKERLTVQVKGNDALRKHVATVAQQLVFQSICEKKEQLKTRKAVMILLILKE